MKPPFTTDYDEHGDVLYITGSDNRPADGVEINGILFRYAQDTGELVGLTVLYPSMHRDPGTHKAPTASERLK